jgi:Cu(I)/Ag(I) efflux system membrane protein CusA/SilA
MITSTIHVLILVPVFFLLMKRRELRAGRLRADPSSKPAERLATTQ